MEGAVVEEGSGGESAPSTSLPNSVNSNGSI